MADFYPITSFILRTVTITVFPSSDMASHCQNGLEMQKIIRALNLNKQTIPRYFRICQASEVRSRNKKRGTDLYRFLCKNDCFAILKLYSLFKLK